MTAENQLSFIPRVDDPTKKNGLSLYFDGAARNNPGPAGAGIMIKRNNIAVCAHGFYLGSKTNNQAEYLALILGIILVKKHMAPQEHVTIYGDSELLVQQMTGNYRVKNPTLQQLFNAAYILSTDLSLTFKHIPRLQNKSADQLANKGIDTHNPIPDEYKRILNEYNVAL